MEYQNKEETTIEDVVSRELLNGLTAKHKYIPAWYRYDKEGSRLNDLCIEKSKWYYFHRYEVSLLQQIIEDVVGHLSEHTLLVDLGSGNAVKTRLFIDQLLIKNASLTYIPVDISEDYLNVISKKIKNEYGRKIIVNPIGGEYLDAVEKVRMYSKRKLFVWFGSLQNLPYHDQVRYLTEISKRMRDDDRLLITVDITDSSKREIIEMGYLDPDGYGGSFHLNSIHRLNKEMDANFDLSKFTIKNELKKVDSIDGCSSVRVWIEAEENCTVDIGKFDLSVGIEKGEKIFLHSGHGISCKYSIAQIKSICEKGSLGISNYWNNDHVACLLLFRKE